MSQSPKKTTGEIGPTRITTTAKGQTAEIIHTELPIEKEGLEDFFASRFIAIFNDTQPIGPKISISHAKQNDTSDLDFNISCAIADYMELAELNPRSEAFGRSAMRDGKFNVYDYAKWIFNRLIKKKALSYGPAVAGRTILLLYATHWQFFPSEGVIQCLHSHIQVHGCDFAAVFSLMTNGDDLRVLSPIHPFSGPQLPKPSSWSGSHYRNLAPGQFSWQIS
jgi:hypothetical protein